MALRLPWLRYSAAWKSHGGAALTVATVICGLEIPRRRYAYRGYDTLRPGNPTVALRLPWLRYSAAWKSHGGATLTVATILCGLEIPRWRCAYRGYGYLRPGNPMVALRLPWLRLSAAWKSHGGAALTVATVFAVK
ncbi:hypothetical protein AB8R05_22070 [Klebsiella variicola]|uniref:hypothetical protein n=1 Tax=Klebsiella variicola TaxID=244366 RepID=UPI00103542BA|nr:hypothetical protein [Klebsiella variicola]MCS5935606.1 hypothetical protein [Klebsiella variicola subsp. variicola]EKZ6232865.1 hypothetical protein [Klebsiella variicola]ELA3610248.1 hypothetical protein [Klebsiella variicola]MCI4420707.1 hypothetical protein [Klebsiella variicola]MCS6052786.1 hypothetical protein [Klebsiella variicola subsp. variicola]